MARLHLQQAAPIPLPNIQRDTSGVRPRWRVRVWQIEPTDLTSKRGKWTAPDAPGPWSLPTEEQAEAARLALATVLTRKATRGRQVLTAGVSDGWVELAAAAVHLGHPVAVTLADGPRRRHRARTLTAAEEAVLLVLAAFRRPVSRAEVLGHAGGMVTEFVSREALGEAVEGLLARGSIVEAAGRLTRVPAACRATPRRPPPVPPAEEWRPVARAGGRWEVSDRGRLRTWDDPGRTTVRPVAVTYPDGVPTVGLPGSGRLVAVARLVLEAFDGPPFPGVRVGYRDGDEGNVRRDNLVWA